MPRAATHDAFDSTEANSRLYASASLCSWHDNNVSIIFQSNLIQLLTGSTADSSVVCLDSTSGSPTWNDETIHLFMAIDSRHPFRTLTDWHHPSRRCNEDALWLVLDPSVSLLLLEDCPARHVGS